jgi:phosphoribosylformylglycinamidine synthase
MDFSNNVNQTFDFAHMRRKKIAATLQEHNIALSPDEALTIQCELLKRPPSLTECILWAIQSSEHCSYKSTRQYLKKLPTTGPNVILAAKEDAGIINVAQDNQGRRYCIAISHESHNHPSQIVPFEGAATGVGGNVRDVCCMGAEVIALSDSLRFGDIKNNKTKWIHENVVAGIASYGNALGIPNINGDLYYDPDYNDNCLVTVVTLGIVREDQIIHSYAPKNAIGYDLILVGKATDNSGFGGASFASLGLKEEEKEQNRGAVQEPNAFLGRHLLKAHYDLFKILQEKNLINKVGFKDLGAGGIACASVELAESGGYGAEIDLAAIPTSMQNLHPAVILCSETQERYMWTVNPEITPLILQHYNETFDLPSIAEQSQAKVIGKITDGNYVVNYQDEKIVDSKAEDICKGLSYDRPCKEKETKLQELQLPSLPDHNQTLLNLLAHENIASRKPVFEIYDKQVQGRTFIERGQADAGIMHPFNSEEFPHEIREVGIALSSAQNPHYNKIDAYWGAINAVARAMRDVAAVGSEPVAITDCLCYGNPEKPEQMAEFAEGIRGIVDICTALSIPVVAGNVSLYNESQNGPIPPSPVICCLGKLTHVSKAITPHFKHPDSLLILIGECNNKNIPQPDFKELGGQIMALNDAIISGLILSARNIADGGVAVALATMSFTKAIGIDINIPDDLSNEIKLFSESCGFVLEVDKANIVAIRNIFHKYGIATEMIGHTISEPELRMQDCINIAIADAKAAWEDGLRNKLL